jgi:RNA polymerase sigma-70 factor (ECF subfamily)
VVNAIAPRAVAIDAPRRARLEGMVARDYRLIWRLLRRVGLPRPSADDAAQQVFLIAAERLDDIQPGKERAFVYGTALRVAQSARRKRDREPPGLDHHESELVARAPDPEQLVSQRRQREALDRVLGELPLELRAVFVLFELEGLSSPEIAALSDLPLGTVASRLRRAREQFREQCRLHGEMP